MLVLIPTYEVTLNVKPATQVFGKPIKFSGTVTPAAAAAGSVVLIQRFTGSWKDARQVDDYGKRVVRGFSEAEPRHLQDEGLHRRHREGAGRLLGSPLRDLEVGRNVTGLGGLAAPRPLVCRDRALGPPAPMPSGSKRG